MISISLFYPFLYILSIIFHRQKQNTTLSDGALLQWNYKVVMLSVQ